MPLDDLIKEYAPNIKKALDSKPEYKEMATAPDGNIYGCRSGSTATTARTRTSCG